MGFDGLGRRRILGGIASSIAALSGGKILDDRSPSEGNTMLPVDRNQVKVAGEGKVVPVAVGLDQSDAIDPESTPTPVNDAIEKISGSQNKRGFGAVILPPSTIEEAAPIIPSEFIQIIGWGINTSKIEFIDLAGDGIRVTDLKEGWYVHLDGFTLSGSDKSERNGGSAIHFDNNSGYRPKHFNIGRLGFREWIGPVIHCERGSPFGCRWEYLDFGFGHNNGCEIVLENDQSLMGTQIGYISAGNATGDTVLDIRFAGAKIFIGYINVGGSAGQALQVKSTSQGHINVGGINFESGVTVDKAAVSLNGPASTCIDYVRTMNVSVDSVIRLGRQNGNNIIRHVEVSDNTTVRVGKIEIADEPEAPSYYFGSADEIVNTVRSTQGKIWALGDMVAVDGGHTPATGRLERYVDPDNEDLECGELAFVSDRSGSGKPAFVYKNDTNELHFWDPE
jgi:hypothetical protein